MEEILSSREYVETDTLSVLRVVSLFSGGVSFVFDNQGPSFYKERKEENNLADDIAVEVEKKTIPVFFSRVPKHGVVQ